MSKLEELEGAAKICENSFHLAAFYTESEIRVALREAFKTGAEWQESQGLSQERIDELLTAYISSVDPLDKIKIAQYTLVVLAQTAIDTNSGTVKLSTDMTYKDRRYDAQMVISFKEDKKKSEEIRLEKKMDMIMRGGRPTLTGYVFTQAQFDKLAPYVKDSDFLNVLKSRVLRK